MGPSNSNVVLCKCMRCRELDPHHLGMAQKRSTARSHYDRQDTQCGWPIGWSRDHPGVAYSVPAQSTNDRLNARIQEEAPLADDQAVFSRRNPSIGQDELDEEAAHEWRQATPYPGVSDGDELLAIHRRPSFSSDDSDSNPDTSFDPEDEELFSRPPSTQPSSSRSASPDACDIQEDPLFRARSALYDPEQPGGAFTPEEPADVPSAFEDDPAVRHAYIRTFVSATFHNSTHDAVKNVLDGYYSSFRTLQAHGVQLEGVENFARTLRTVERRIGVSTEGLITYLFACPSCWKTHRPAELTELDGALCADTEKCTGVLFTVKRMVDGKQKRTPTFLMPLVRPSSAIARMCMQPGKVGQWQQWRCEGDEVNPVPPLSETGFAAFADPSKPMRDVCDGWAWRAATAGLEFQSVKNGCHSSGALYTTILNNPRSIRYLREETQLSMMFPGPHEPTLKQLNNAMREYKDNLAMLYNGITLPVLGENGEVHDAPVHCLMHNDVSDLPASRKTSALAGCTSIHFMCPLCPATFYSLASVQCYDRSKFILRDPWRYLKYSFRSRDLGIEYKEEIFNRRGIRYSVMHELPNWLPGVTGVIDYMHCTYLCMIKHLCKDILLKTGMLDGAASTKMEALYNKLVWPPSVSRMPPSISRGAGSIKADNWKTQIVILFVALFVAWQVDGEIPASQAPLPSTNTNNAKALDNQQRLYLKYALNMRKQHADRCDASENSGPTFEDARMDRSYRKHYDAVLEFSAALAILSSHAISPNDVKRGTAMYSRAVQAWARMHCHLTPYFHLAMHFEDQYYRSGPCTGWWAFPYERNNGFLGRFKNNGHSGELISRLEALPRPHAREDSESWGILRNCLRGGTSERHGSQQIFQARAEVTDSPGM
ncbi:hypothetical protein HDZ31DRAFT_75965 [Schizophyllum fasciatum]